MIIGINRGIDHSSPDWENTSYSFYCHWKIEKSEENKDGIECDVLLPSSIAKQMEKILPRFEEFSSEKAAIKKFEAILSENFSFFQFVKRLLAHECYKYFTFTSSDIKLFETCVVGEMFSPFDEYDNIKDFSGHYYRYTNKNIYDRHILDIGNNRSLLYEFYLADDPDQGQISFIEGWLIDNKTLKNYRLYEILPTRLLMALRILDYRIHGMGFMKLSRSMKKNLQSQDMILQDIMDMNPEKHELMTSISHIINPISYQHEDLIQEVNDFMDQFVISEYFLSPFILGAYAKNTWE